MSLDFALVILTWGSFGFFLGSIVLIAENPHGDENDLALGLWLGFLIGVFLSAILLWAVVHLRVA